MSALRPLEKSFRRCDDAARTTDDALPRHDTATRAPAQSRRRKYSKSPELQDNRQRFRSATRKCTGPGYTEVHGLMRYTEVHGNTADVEAVSASMRIDAENAACERCSPRIAPTII